MVKVNDLLSKRFKKSDKSLAKMQDLAKRSSDGNLSSFSGIFRVASLSENEGEELKNILKDFTNDKATLDDDLLQLKTITSEVKAINNQAAILHGERIKLAQELLGRYRDGAFTTWLIYTYGNRQTPYNFMQYYELYSQMPKMLQEKVDIMPRQAVYTLATRKTTLDEKKEVIENYNGETKQQLLTMIRERFPLGLSDKRNKNLGEQALKGLRSVLRIMERKRFKPSKKMKQEIEEVINMIGSQLD